MPVLYVHGNHEGYGHNLDSVLDEIRSASAATDNVHLLDCGEYIVGQVRFLGATLWMDFQLFGDDERHASMLEAENVMTDYKRIRLAKKCYRKLRATDTLQYHAMQKSWLNKKLQECAASCSSLSLSTISTARVNDSIGISSAPASPALLCIAAKASQSTWASSTRRYPASTACCR